MPDNVGRITVGDGFRFGIGLIFAQFIFFGVLALGGFGLFMGGFFLSYMQ